MMKMVLQTTKSIAVSLGLMLLLPLALYYAIQVANPYPEYNPPHHNESAQSEEGKAANQAYQKDHQLQVQKYESIYFYTSLVVGSLLIIIGAFAAFDFFGFGFIMGGVFSIITGYFNYWSQLNNLIKLLSLLGAIALLLIVGLVMARKH